MVVVTPAFWTRTLEGMLHSVTVAHQGLIKPAEIRAAGMSPIEAVK